MQSDMVDPEVSPETRLLLLEQERAMWLRTSELYKIRYRVGKRLESEEDMKDAKSNLIKCETALDEIRVIIKETHAFIEKAQPEQASR